MGLGPDEIPVGLDQEGPGEHIDETAHCVSHVASHDSGTSAAKGANQPLFGGGLIKAGIGASPNHLIHSV
jgi:hypothetical protein